MADEVADKSLVCSDTAHRKLKKEQYPEKQTVEVFDEDFLCPICLQLLIEPVVLPCKHELCKICFTQNVQEANLQCPICRVRISSWARKQARNGTLICRERWEVIQRLFPKKCERRMAGEDDESEDFYRQRPLKRVLSENGAIRSEYEEEMKKIRKAREEEARASKELIHRLMEEEEIVDHELQQMIDNDEELAKRLQQQTDTPIQVQTPLKPSSNKKVLKRTKTKSKTPVSSHTLEKWFLPTRKLSSNNTHTSVQKNPTHCLEVSTSHSHNRCQTSTHSSSILKQKQEKEDFALALKLQQEFDQEREHQKLAVNRKKGTVDGYLLRQNTSSDSSSS